MQKKTNNKFIRGPLKVDVIASLIREGPPSALNTYLVLLYLAGLRKTSHIIPKNPDVALFGISARSFRRGLITLQTRGIIAVYRSTGVRPVVDIL